MMQRLVIITLLLGALAGAAIASGPWAWWYPAAPVGSRLPRSGVNTDAPAPGGQRIEAGDVDPRLLDGNDPLTWDPNSAAVVVDPEWTAAVEQDRSRLAGAVPQAVQACGEDLATLDTVDADLAALLAMPDAGLDTVSELRTALRATWRNQARLAAVARRDRQMGRRIVRWAGRQAGAEVPAEQ